MLKIVEPDSWNFAEPVVTRVPILQSGRIGWGDRQLLLKRAGDQLFDALGDVTFKEGEVPVHVIALGATETYGCFVAGTPIAMSDGRYKPVEEIQVGDQVLSADGHDCPVTCTFRRLVPETLTIDVCGLPDLLQVSLDHPFRVARKEQFVCDHDRHKRCLPPTQGVQNICNRPTNYVRECVLEEYRTIHWEWATAKSLREGDFLIWTVPDLPVPYAMSTDEGYLLGAWLAEGSFQRNSSNNAVSSIVLDIHAGEDEFLARLERSAAALDLKLRSHVYDDEPNSRRVGVTGNPPLFRLWHQLFNEHARHKILPPWVCCLPSQVRAAILAGYLDGDGSCVVDEKENRTTARSRGVELSMGLQRLCWSLGLPAVRCRAVENGYNLAIANSYLGILEPFSWKVRGRPLRQTTKVHGFFHQGRMYLPVRGIQWSAGGEVFNFEVEGDHTYSGPNIDSHNCNRNGDSFPKDVCRRYHKTYENQKIARWFRDHQNRDVAKSYGRIKKAFYNEDMARIELLVALNGTKQAADRNGGLVADLELEDLEKKADLPTSMACFLDPEFPILTKDRGYVPIAQIQTNDEVWTHQRRWRRVKQLNRRRYSGEVMEIRLNGLPIPIQVTADHPFWAKVFAGSREVGAVKAKARGYFRDSQAFESEPAGWNHATHLGKGDRLFYAPVDRFPGYCSVDNADLALLLGYYLAEGSLRYNCDRASTVVYTCHADDSLPRLLPKIVERLWPEVTVTLNPKSNCEVALELHVHSTALAEFVRTLIGANVANKRIPPELFNSPEDVRLAFICGWLDGDGWADAKGGHWSSSNRNLVLQGRDLLASLGIPSTIYRIDHSKCATSGYENSGVEYTLNVSRLEVHRLAKYSTKAAAYPPQEAKREKPATMRLCPDGLYAYRVADVKVRYVQDEVTYNFEVEEDESYSAAGIISHNCAVSEDICSSCGNHAKTRKDYCDEDSCVGPRGEKRGGCKKHLAKVAEDGHQLCVHNPDPHFFDISRVRRNADRTSWATKADWLKAAADGVLGGAELAERHQLTAPTAILLAQYGLTKSASVMDQIHLQLAVGLAQLEEMPIDRSPAVKLPFAGFEPIDVAKLGVPGTKQGAAALGALADEGVVLTLEEFATWTLGAQGTKLASDAARDLPGVFDRLLGSGELLGRLATSRYLPGEEHASLAQRQFAKAAAVSRGLLREAIEERLTRAVLRGQTEPTFISGNEKRASAGEAAESLLRDYAVYQLGALGRIARHGDSFMLTAANVLLQNRLNQ